MPKERKILLAILGVVLLAVGGNYLVLQPLKEAGEEVSAEAVQTAELEIARENLANLEVLKREAALLERDAKNKAFYYFKDPAQIDNYIKTLNKDYVGKLKLKIDGPKVARQDKKRYVYTLSANGDYAAVLELLHTLESSWPTIYISNFSLNRPTPQTRYVPPARRTTFAGDSSPPNPRMALKLTFAALLENLPPKTPARKRR